MRFAGSSTRFSPSSPSFIPPSRERSNEGDRRAMGRAAIVGLCAPRVAPGHALSGAMLLAVLAFVLVS